MEPGVKSGPRGTRISDFHCRTCTRSRIFPDPAVPRYGSSRPRFYAPRCSLPRSESEFFPADPAPVSDRRTDRCRSEDRLLRYGIPPAASSDTIWKWLRTPSGSSSGKSPKLRSGTGFPADKIQLQNSAPDIFSFGSCWTVRRTLRYSTSSLPQDPAFPAVSLARPTAPENGNHPHDTTPPPLPE